MSNKFALHSGCCRTDN